jgi:hypothetical protein
MEVVNHNPATYMHLQVNISNAISKDDERFRNNSAA